jgi:hypothetical protein
METLPPARAYRRKTRHVGGDRFGRYLAYLRHNVVPYVVPGQGGQGKSLPLICGQALFVHIRGYD